MNTNSVFGKRFAIFTAKILAFLSSLSVSNALDWSSNNIGIPAGGQVASVPLVTSPSMVLQGAGEGIGGGSDSFHFLSYEHLMGGNLEVEARVQISSFSGPGGAEGGVMLRESHEVGAAFAALVVNSGREIFFKWRSSSGAVSAESLGRVPEGQTHCWLRLKRDGYFVAGYQSADGINWQLVGSAVYGLTPASLSAALKVGLCMCSNTPSFLASTAFDNFRALPFVPQRVIPGAVTSTMRLWLRSDWNARANSAGQVGFWEDQSGYANDAVSSEDTYNHMPQIITNAIAGKPVLRFGNPWPDNNGRKFMTIQDHGSLSAQGLSVFVVARWSQTQTSTPPHAGILSKGASASVGYFLGFNGGSPRFRGMTAVSTWASPLLAPSLELPHLLSGEFLNAASLSLRVDGESPAATTVATAASLAANTTPLYIGQCVTSATLPTPAANIFPFEGDIAEIIIYQNSPASSGMPLERRREMDAYFRAKYGIQTMTLPPAPQPSLFLAGQAVDGGIFTGLEEGLVSFVVPDGGWVYYKINGGPTMLYTGPFTPTLTGEVNITAWTEKPGHDKSPDEVCSFLIDAETDYLPREDMKLWLRADRGVTLTSGKVSSWKSQAAETNYLAVETVVASMPLLIPASSHGKSTIQFPDASSTRLKIATANSPPNLNSYTVFVAGRHSTGAAAGIGRLISRTSATSNGYYFGLTKSANGSAWVAWQSRKTSATATGAGQTATTAPSLYIEPSPAWNVLSARSDTLERLLRINGTEQQSLHSPSAPLAADSTADFWLGTAGTTEYFKGEIAEVLLYDRTLTLQEVREVEAYLAGRYSPQHRPKLALTGTPTGTYAQAVSVQFSTVDQATISYQMNSGSGWSDWQTSTSGTIAVLVGQGLTMPQTYVFRVKASKEGFVSDYTEADPLIRSIRIDPGTTGVPRSNLKLWLRADTGVSTVGLPEGQGVSNWEDQSGSQNHLTAAAYEHPLYLPASGGEPECVQFGAGPVVGRMTPKTPNEFKLGNLPDNDLLVVAVVKDEGTSGLGTLYELSNATATTDATAGFLLQLDHLTAPTRLRSQMLHQASAAFTTNPNTLGQGFNLFTQMIKATPVRTHQVFVDRVNEGNQTTTVTTNTDAQSFALGARRSTSGQPGALKGKLLELLIYDQPPTAAQINDLDAYLLGRHGLAAVSKPSLQTVTAVPGSGIWSPQKQITLNHAVAGAVIKYRHYLVGDAPSAWITYDMPFAITTSGRVVLETKAEKAGYADSLVSTFDFKIETDVALLPRNNLAVWLRADQGAAGTVVGGELRVASWKDQSGNGYVASSGVFPPRQLKSTAFRNNPAELVDVMNFGRGAPSPVNYSSSQGPSLSMPNPSVLNGTSLTAFVVSRSLGWPGTDTNESIIVKRYGSSSGWQITYRDRPSGVTNDSGNYRGIQLHVKDSGVVQAVSHVMIAPSDNNTIYSRPTLTTVSVHNSAPLKVMPNSTATGEVQASQNYTANFSSQTENLLMGCDPGIAQNFLNAEVAEVLLYNAMLSADEMRAVHDYLVKRYDFAYLKPLAPPAISPNGGVFQTPQVVTVTGPEGSAVQCAVNGEPVTASGNTATFTVAPPPGAENQSFSAEIVATCSKPGYALSPVSSAAVVIDPAAAMISEVVKDKIRLWLRADAGVSTAASGGLEVVHQWGDLSGYGHHLAQALPVASPRKQPTLVLNEGGLNGRPAVRFENTSAAKTHLFANHAGLNSTKASVFAVLKRSANTLTSESVIAEKYDVTGAKGYSLRMTNSAVTTPFKFMATSGQSTYTVPALSGGGPDTSLKFVGGTQDPTHRKLFIQGDAIDADAAATQITSAVSAFYLGSNLTPALHLDADVAELWMFNSGLSQEEVDQLSSYVHQRYGLMSTKKLPVPVPNHQGGIYSAIVQVQLTSPMPGATIRYVLGEPGVAASAVPDPSESSNVAPAVLSFSSGSRVLKVRSYKTGFVSSDVGEWTFRIEPQSAVIRDGLAVWLRADCDVSRDTVSNKVSKWRDQSGKGNDAVAPEALAHQPTYLADGTGITGHPALQFNVTGGTLPIHLEVPAIADIDTGVVSFFAIARKAGTNNGVIAKRGGGELRMAGTAAAPTGVMATNNVESASIPITANQYVLLAGTYDGAYRRISNGYLADTEAYTIALTAGSALMIGAEVKTTNGYALQGEIAELLVYNRGLSSSEREEVEGYLARRYPQVRLPVLPSPIFVPSAMNGGASGGTHYATEPGTVVLYSPGGGRIYWVAPPLVDWQLYQKPIPVFHTTTIHAKTVGESWESPAVMGTFHLDPLKYPAPTPAVGDTTPPVLRLDNPTNAVEITNP